MSLPAARDEYTVRDSMGSYRTRLHLNALARATGEQSLFIAAGEHCRVFVITGNAVLITQSFYSSSILTIPLQRFSPSAIVSTLASNGCKVISVDARGQATAAGVSSISLSSYHGRHIVCRVRFSLAYIFRDAYNLFGRVFRPR